MLLVISDGPDIESYLGARLVGRPKKTEQDFNSDNLGWDGFERLLT